MIDYSGKNPIFEGGSLILGDSHVFWKIYEMQIGAVGERPWGVLAGSESPGRELPLWLMDAGVTFNFEDRSAPDLLFGEVEELLDEYQKMICALRDLAKEDKNRTFDT